MSYLKSFKIFESNNNINISGKSISDDMLSQEMVDTCNDIVRDFNEDNDTSITLDIIRVYTDAILPERVREKLLKAKNIIYIRPNLRTNWSRVRQSDDKIERDNNLKEECIKHITSYFTSLGYKHLNYNGSRVISTFFYLSDESVEVNPIKRFGKYVKSKLFESKNCFLGDSSDKIDTEIIHNCDDILRDFNEDNNCEFDFVITYRANSSAIINHINPMSAHGYRIAGKVMSVLGDKKDIIEIFIRPTGYISSTDIWDKLKDQRDDCMKHIISYFNSIGYKYLLNGAAIYYFYKD